MERTKKVKSEESENLEEILPIEEVKLEEEESPLLLWRKIGGGGIHWNSRIIKPNQTFSAREEDLPKAFRDLFECVEQDKLKVILDRKKGINQIKEDLYELKSISKLKWDVINSNSKKPINDKPLSKEQAEALLQSLEAK